MFAVSRPRHRWRWGAWQENLRQDLAFVRSWVDTGPVDVFLVGGLGLAVRNGSFHRNHGDIDLAVFTHDLPAFSRHVAACGYDWAQPVAGLALTPWHRLDLARVVESPQAASALRLTRRTDSRVQRTPRRADFMDVMLLEERPAGIALLGYSAVVPREDFFPPTGVAGCRRLWLPNPQYKRHLPARWPRQRRDLRVAALA